MACACRSNGPFNHGVLTTITVPSRPRNCFNFIRFTSGKITDKIVENKTHLYSQLLVDVEVSIAKVEREIAEVEANIQRVEPRTIGGDDTNYWREKEKILREEKQILREKEKILREEKQSKYEALQREETLQKELKEEALQKELIIKKRKGYKLPLVQSEFSPNCIYTYRTFSICGWINVEWLGQHNLNFESGAFIGVSGGKVGKCRERSDSGTSCIRKDISASVVFAAQTK
jgi:hypothetical protein